MPAVTIETCGGFVDNSSAAINFMDGAALTPGQRCVWVVKGPYDSSRFNLVTSGLGSGDHLYVTKYDAATAMPGAQIEIVATGTNYTVAGGMVLVTLVVGDAPSMGFSLTYFSSGFGDSSPALTGFATRNENIGSHSYPASGQYRNGESAMFIVNPSQAGDRTLKFSSLDVENDSTCRYDAVALYTWSNNAYNQVDRFCGTTTPSGFQIPGGLAMITFVTDSSVVGSGFTFDWA
jgi:cubilin